MKLQNEGYRGHFMSAKKAAEYESVQYGPGSYGSILWEVEKLQLQTLLDELRSTVARIDYLDFATGTGRLLSFMEDKVDSSTGIEISEVMAGVAADRNRASRILCKDITDGREPPEGRYDLITAYRFFLNAEPDLRVSALAALTSRLRSRSSWLILNNHGNPWSHKIAAYPFHAVRRIIDGPGLSGNYLTDSEMRRLIEGAGLRITRRLTCGFLSAKIARLMRPERAIAIEKRMASMALIQSLGVNMTYVAQLR